MMNENEKESTTSEQIFAQEEEFIPEPQIQSEAPKTEINFLANSNLFPEDLTIGQLIKQKREEKGLSLKVISQQTKIHIGLLEHLENDNYSKLPSKTYIRGFVKSTAKILGINQDDALFVLENSYRKMSAKKETKIYHAPPPDNKLESKYAPNTPFSSENLKSVFITYASSTLKFGAVFALIVVIGINLKNYIKNSGKDSNIKLPVVLTTMHQKSKPAPKPIAPKIEVKPQDVEPIKVNLIQENKKDLNDKDKTEIIVNDLKLKTPAPLEKQFKVVTNLTNEQLDNFLPKRFRFSPIKGQEAIFINATEGDSWITYKVDDKEIKKYVLRQGRTVFMRGEKVRLFVGNTKNVKIFHNNQLIEVSSDTTMKNLVFPEELKTKYMSPLFVFQKDGTVLTSDEFIKINHTETNNKQVPNLPKK